MMQAAGAARMWKENAVAFIRMISCLGLVVGLLGLLPLGRGTPGRVVRVGLRADRVIE